MNLTHLTTLILKDGKPTLYEKDFDLGTEDMTPINGLDMAISESEIYDLLTDHAVDGHMITSLKALEGWDLDWDTVENQLFLGNPKGQLDPLMPDYGYQNADYFLREAVTDNELAYVQAVIDTATTARQIVGCV